MLPDPLLQKRTIEYKGFKIATKEADELARAIADAVMRSRAHIMKAGQFRFRVVQIMIDDILFTAVVGQNEIQIVRSNKK